MVFLLDSTLAFPDPALADEDGLLAVGGDLMPERLILAYQHGIFPWFSEGDPICWYSPHERFVIFASEIHISRSMSRLIRSGTYTVTFDQAFRDVITHCSAIKRKGQKGTWITADMIAAYIALHERGIAHSIEVWHDGKLIGGMYGVAVGRVFCGESMFSLRPDASKLAMIWLCQNKNYELIDCQLHTSHLESMGARFISREAFMGYLSS